jgi:hypothetical protein
MDHRIALARRLRSELNELKGPLTSRQAAMLFGVIWVAAVIFTIIYVEKETPTWFWDYANYHEKYKELIGMFDDGIFPFIQIVRRSILNSQHNITPVIPLLGGRLLLGPHRVGYILSLVILYLLPACLISAALGREAWRERGASLTTLAITGFALLYHPFWAPTLRGHPDVICVLPLASATLLLLRSRYLLQASPIQSAVIGLLLWSSFLLRRHTLFTVGSLLAATVLFAGLACLSSGFGNSEGWRRVGRWGRNIAYLVVAMVLPAWLFQHAYLQEILNPAYSGTFGAYRESLSSQMEVIYGVFGPVLLGSAAVGGVLAGARRRGGVLFCGLVAGLAFLGFQTTQAPSDHHLLILSLFLFPAACAPFVILGSGFRNPLIGWLMGAWFLLPAFGFLQTFPLSARSFPSRQPNGLELLAPPRTYSPLRLASYEEVKALVRALRQLTEAERGQTSFAILASSDQLNSHIVRAIGRKKLRDHMVSVSEVDLRDAFQLTTLDADYIVACDPPATHLGEKNQRVISVLSKALITNDNPIHRAYRRLPGLDQRLADGSTASIYERLVPPNEEQVAWLHKEFRRFYPSWERYPTHLGKPRGGF